MAKRVTTTIHISQAQLDAIRRLSLATCVPQSVLIRGWIDEGLEPECKARLGMDVGRLMSMDHEELESMRRRCLIGGGWLEADDGP